MPYQIFGMYLVITLQLLTLFIQHTVRCSSMPRSFISQWLR